MSEHNTTLSEDDKAQIEYLKQWRKQQEIKLQRKCIRNFHLQSAKDYFKIAVEELVLWFKCCTGKDV